MRTVIVIAWLVAGADGVYGPCKKSGREGKKKSGQERGRDKQPNTRP